MRSNELTELHTLLVESKPRGWSCVLKGRDRISLRPPKRDVGKFSVSLSGAGEVCIMFFDVSKNRWTDTTYLIRDPTAIVEWVVEILARKEGDG
jgi:hypothetical protein